jgi:hypothetical protein
VRAPPVCAPYETHAPVAQLVEAIGLEPMRCGFESCSAHRLSPMRLFRRVGKAPRGGACPRCAHSRGHGASARLCPPCMRIRVAPRARGSSPVGRGDGFKPRTVQVRVLPAAPRSRALSSEAEHLSYTQGAGVSKSSARTMSASLVQRQNAGSTRKSPWFDSTKTQPTPSLP